MAPSLSHQENREGAFVVSVTLHSDIIHIQTVK